MMGVGGGAAIPASASAPSAPPASGRCNGARTETAAPPMPTAASYNGGEYDNDNDEYNGNIDEDDIFPDNNLYC